MYNVIKKVYQDRHNTIEEVVYSSFDHINCEDAITGMVFDEKMPEGHKIANIGWWYRGETPIEYRIEYYPETDYICNTDIVVVLEIVEA